MSGERVGVWLSVALALVAGFVDAIGFLWLFGVFPVNQSGNTVLIGVAIGEADWDTLWPSLASVAAFGAGIFASVRLQQRSALRRPVATRLAAQTALLAVVSVWVLLLNTGSPIQPMATRLSVLALLSFTMGIQTHAVHRAAGVAVATTYQTGAVVRISESLARPLSAPQRATVRVLSAVLVGYVLGAACGAALGSAGPGLLWLSALATAVLLVGQWAAQD